MQQEDPGYYHLAEQMPNSVREYADQNIFVKKDNLEENFDKLRDILDQNLDEMKEKGITLEKERYLTDEEWEIKCKEIKKMMKKMKLDEEQHIPKKPFPKIPTRKTCGGLEGVRDAIAYYLIFPEGERIAFHPSSISTSDGASVNGQNARNLYGSEAFERCFADAVRDKNPNALFGLLKKYAMQDDIVNREHLRNNLYRKNTAADTYRKVEQGYDMDNFFQSAVDNYNKRPGAQPYKAPNKSYPEYMYDKERGYVRGPFIIEDKNGKKLFIDECYEDIMNNKNIIDCQRPKFYIQRDRELIPVYEANF